jgi:hypothetical protein
VIGRSPSREMLMSPCATAHLIPSSIDPFNEKRPNSVLAAVSLALALAGCATRTQMPLQLDTDRLTEKSKPIYLMTATIKNTYRIAASAAIEMRTAQCPSSNLST